MACPDRKELADFLLIFRELEIVGTSLTLDSVTLLLSSLKELSKLKAVKLAQALESVKSPLKLTECTPETDRHGFVTATSGKHLEILAEKCPNLDTLSFFSEANYDSIDFNNNQIDFDNFHDFLRNRPDR